MEASAKATGEPGPGDLKPGEVRVDFAIRPYDVDVAGIVSNIVYVRWLEDLRMEMLARVFPPGELGRRRLMPVVVRTEIDYRSSLRFHDACAGLMRLEAVGNTSVRLRARFTDGHGATAAEAMQVGVFLDTESNRPARVPDEIRALVAGPAGATGAATDRP
jgi:acyl-CoA thioester hydrolase